MEQAEEFEQISTSTVNQSRQSFESDKSFFAKPAASQEGLESLVPLVNKLQNALNQIKAKNSIDLPQLVVVGAQSAGKSSVLESIVGKDFLPRGSGIVTRCPLVLQLRRIEPKGKQPQPTEYAEFLHKAGTHFTDFNKVRAEIQDQTNKLAGKDKGVTDQPISLIIYSENLIDLTLVDLPGLTKVPIKDQAKDIEAQIKRLILRYIRPENALILALTPANTDLANSDALQLAREVDPKGDRTIGVITKIDLMDEGTDAIEILQGKLYPLKLGYFGVKCRSQKQIDENLPIKDAMQIEAEFFSRHPIYAQYSSKMGIPFLTKSLNRHLVRHIQMCMPDLTKQITLTIQQKERELAAYNMNFQAIDRQNMGPIILHLITRFIEEYNKKLDGNFVREITTECLGGARINFIFHKIFKNAITKIDPFENLTEQDIQTAIKNASAMSPSLFVPEAAFEVLTRQQIARLLEPSIQCAQLVYEELKRIVLQIHLPELQRYYKLQSRMHDVMESVLDSCLNPTNEMILDLIEIETSLINTNHPDFIGSADSLLNLFQEQEPPKELDDEQPKTFSLLKKTQQESAKPATDGPAKPLKTETQEVEDQKKADERPEARPSRSWIPSFFSKGQQPTQPADSQPRKEEPTMIIEEREERKATFGMAARRFEANFENRRPVIDEHGNLPEIFLAEVPQKLRSHPDQESARIIMETRVIQNLIYSYFSIVKKNIADLVPKTVMALLIRESARMAQSELVVKVYQADDVESLLVEDPIVAANRESCQQVIKALRSAQMLLADVKQYRL